MSNIPADTWAFRRLTFIIHHDRLCNIGTIQGHFVLMRSCQSGPSNIALMALQTCLLQSAWKRHCRCPAGLDYLLKALHR